MFKAKILVVVQTQIYVKFIQWQFWQVGKLDESWIYLSYSGIIWVKHDQVDSWQLHMLLPIFYGI